MKNKLIVFTLLNCIISSQASFAMSDEQKNTIKRTIAHANLRNLQYHPQFEANLNRTIPTYAQIRQRLARDDFYEGLREIKSDLIQNYHAHHNNNSSMKTQIINQLTFLELDTQQNRLIGVGITSAFEINNAAINQICRDLDIPL